MASTDQTPFTEHRASVYRYRRDEPTPSTRGAYGSYQPVLTSEQPMFKNPDQSDFLTLSAETNETEDNDWNAAFQSILEHAENTEDETNHKYKLLAKLSTDFVETCKHYSRLIVSERYLPDSEKTIKPTKIGGLAGGTKYIVQGILYKLSRDPELQEGFHLFGGTGGVNLEFAQKVAGHDLRGAVAYWNFLQSQSDESNGLTKTIPRVPMMCVVDYRGFRVTAMPFLPLEKLVYGSADAGITLMTDDHGGYIKKSAKALHLAEHYVGSVKLNSVGDLELHAGTDGRHYLLDFGRALPPESPAVTTNLPADPQAVFYRLFRPEFMTIWKQKGEPALSPDALTGWSRGAPDSHVHNLNIERATDYLVHHVIPAFAADIDRSGKKHKVMEILHPIGEKTHRRGINVRHLGLLRSHVQDKKARQMLIGEILARTLKNIMRSWLRETMRGFSKRGVPPSEFGLRTTVANLINLVSGADDRYKDFWEREILPGAERRFGAVAFTDDERKDLFKAVKSQVFYIIDGAMTGCGFRLSRAFITDWKKKGDGLLAVAVTSADLVSFTRAKHMSIVDYAQGKLLLTQAVAKGQPLQTALRLRHIAFMKFRSALASDTMNVPAIIDCCIGWAWSTEIVHRLRRTDQIIITQLFVDSSLEVAQELFDYMLTLWEGRVSSDIDTVISDKEAKDAVARPSRRRRHKRVQRYRTRSQFKSTEESLKPGYGFHLILLGGASSLMSLNKTRACIGKYKQIAAVEAKLTATSETDSSDHSWIEMHEEFINETLSTRMDTLKQTFALIYEILTGKDLDADVANKDPKAVKFMADFPVDDVTNIIPRDVLETIHQISSESETVTEEERTDLGSNEIDWDDEWWNYDENDLSELEIREMLTPTHLNIHTKICKIVYEKLDVLGLAALREIYGRRSLESVAADASTHELPGLAKALKIFVRNDKK